MLDASYATSRFPVPYFVAQASFDPAQIKVWYATLIAQGTMPTYLYTQHIDYLFMLSTLLLHFLALVIVARLLPEGSRWRRGMLWCTALQVLRPRAEG